MALNTDISLRDSVIYSIYVRNHTQEGTFLSVIPDLQRIKELGTDIIWFMPIHPVGEKTNLGTYIYRRIIPMDHRIYQGLPQGNRRIA